MGSFVPPRGMARCAQAQQGIGSLFTSQHRVLQLLLTRGRKLVLPYVKASFWISVYLCHAYRWKVQKKKKNRKLVYITDF